MVYRAVGTQGPRTYTQEEAARLLVTYGNEIKEGTLIRISDNGNPPGVICVFVDGSWEIEGGGTFSGGGGGTGPKGAKGDQGEIGPAGPKGDTGTPGAKGDKGDKGDTGNTGTPRD